MVASCATMLAMSNDLGSLLSERNMRRIDLAVALGVDKSLVTRWAQGRVPAERVADVERVTGIPREKLRPDIFGAKTEAAQ